MIVVQLFAHPQSAQLADVSYCNKGKRRLMRQYFDTGSVSTKSNEMF